MPSKKNTGAKNSPKPKISDVKPTEDELNKIKGGKTEITVQEYERRIATKDFVK